MSIDTYRKKINAWVGTMTGTSRWGIVSLVVFFFVGGLLVLRVDTAKGVMEAREAEVEFAA